MYDSTYILVLQATPLVLKANPVLTTGVCLGQALVIRQIKTISIQVATALLVAGSTLTFWIPWQTLFASTSLYSSIAQSARLLA